MSTHDMAPAQRAEAWIYLCFQTAVIEPIAWLIGTRAKKVAAVVLLAVVLTASFPRVLNNSAPAMQAWTCVALWAIGLLAAVLLFVSAVLDD